MHAYWLHAFPPRNLWQFVAWFYHANVGAVCAYPLHSSRLGGGLVGLLVLAGVVQLLRRRQFAHLALLVAPVAMTFAAAWWRCYPYGGDVRVQQHLAAGILVLAGMGFAGVWHALATRLRGLSTVAVHVVWAGILLLAVLGILRDLRQPYLRSENDELARQVAKALSGQVGVPLFMPQKTREIPPVLGWYLRQNVADVRSAWPLKVGRDEEVEATYGGAFMLLDCPAVGADVPPPPMWGRSVLVEGAFLYRYGVRPCRVYLYEPAGRSSGR
jgi:hypothetical protein